MCEYKSAQTKHMSSCTNKQTSTHTNKCTSAKMLRYHNIPKKNCQTVQGNQTIKTNQNAHSLRYHNIPKDLSDCTRESDYKDIRTAQYSWRFQTVQGNQTIKTDQNAHSLRYHNTPEDLSNCRGESDYKDRSECTFIFPSQGSNTEYKAWTQSPHQQQTNQLSNKKQNKPTKPT